MSKTYIVETDDETQLLVEIGVNSTGAALIATNPVSFLTPYTEPDTEQVREEAYEDGYKTAKVQCNIQAEKDLREVGERHYQKGLSDAWEAARKIWEYNATTLNKIFSKCCYSVVQDILRKYSASEVIEKIRQYEQEQEIKVGDEVEAVAGKAVIIQVFGNGDVRYMYPDASIGFNDSCSITRTGRHFPEIAKVLRKMKEE